MANAVLLFVGALSAVVGLTVYKGWGIIESALIKRSGTIQLLNGYELSGDRKAAVVQHGSGFTATAVALLDTTKTRELDRGRLEEIIGRTGRPFKLVMVVSPLDISRVLERLRTVQYRGEIELSRLYRGGADDVKIKRAKMRLGAVEADIASITSGKTPLRVLYFVMHAKTSSGRLVAQDGAVSGLLSLCTTFDAALGTRSRLLSGNDLLGALRFDSMIV